MSARPLGMFAALALTPSAWAAEPTVHLSYEAVRSDAGWKLNIYAVNTGSKAVMVDDDPTVTDAEVVTTAGSKIALTTQPDTEMISRMGPRRKWISVQPGERHFVGSSTVGVPDHTVIEGGTMVLTVRLVTMDGYSERVDRVPMQVPGV